MRIRTVSAVSVAGLTGLTAVVLAGPVGLPKNFNSGQQSRLIDYLRAAREDLSRQAASENARGPLLIHYMEERAKLDELINQLKGGKEMAPEGISSGLASEQESGSIDYLQAIREDFAQQAALENVKGPLLIRYMEQRAKLDELIDRLKSGQELAPAEIDQALQPLNR